MRSPQKTFALWVFIVLVVVLVFQFYGGRYQAPGAEFDFPQFMEAVENGEVESATFNRQTGEITADIKEEFEEKYKEKFKRHSFTFVGNTGDEIFKLLRDKGITPKYVRNDSNGFWQSLFVTGLPLLILVVLFVMFMRQLQAGGGKAMSFGKSRARLLTENKNKVTFKDVAGVDEAKEELEEIIEFLKEPKKFTSLGGRIPKGVLLVGPPGTGKTLLARAVAGEAGVPFFTISGSDFVEMFVGVGASRVRDLFEQGKKNAPCLIFIDEIDAVGRHRGAGMGGGHDEREQTLNQLLVEMDGFESNDGVILIAATNRPDVLDPALLRPGRFDRRVVVGKPDVKGRLKILEVHTRKVPMSKEVVLDTLAKGTPGFSGADLQNLVNEASLLAARQNKKVVDMDDFERAKDKVMMGSERRSMVITDEDKKITAYHEAGHTLVGKKIPGTDPIHKVTIIPRGMALGVTQVLPAEERLNLTKQKAHNMIAFLFGGRAAEEIIFGDYTTGAGNDIERATEIARRMVCEWGMSEKLGPLAFEHREGPVFLGMQSAHEKGYSEATAQQIDEEVSKFVMEGHVRAKKILSENLEVLHNLAKALLELETIDGEEVEKIMKGGSLDDLERTRGARAKGLADENKAREEELKKIEEQEKKKKREDDDGRDPVGNPGPVTA
ncbi:MAG: ATP-dependent zinc metalloprotease FtsH [Bdellovibrionales bacterium]|nr:ATP-dependent zinc metalloprotease FtsH [Bdellovibrionales bacterium]